MSVLFATFLMAVATGEVLISTAELAQMDEVIILDARETSAFVEAHIEGARSLPVSSLSEDRDGVPNLLKPISELEAILQNAGVAPGDQVIVYSGMKNGADLHLATRLFWILEYLGYENVAVLDGGLAKWLQEDRPVGHGEVKVEPTVPLDLKPNPARLATKEDVAEATSTKSRQLLDLRSPDQYLGIDKSGSVARAGHIPGACNLPAEQALGADMTFKSKEELGAVAKEQGLKAEAPVTTYCNTGRAASVGYFMLRHLGYEDVALYDGSMAEWTRDNANEVTTGEKP